MAPLLIKDVKKVKQKLDEVDAGALVDLNEIYEKLEFYQIREDRVKHVVSLFLDRFGFDGLDISNASSPIESDDSLENQIDLSYRTKAVKDSDIIKGNSSDSTTEDYSFDFKANGESKKLAADINTAQSSEQSVVCNTEEYVFKLDESDILINTGETDKSKAETATVDLPSGSALLGAQLSSELLSSNPFLSNDYDMDVNNNDPNNNTEYEVPDANLAKSNDRAGTASPRPSPFVPSLDDSDWDFQNQDIIREKLLCEARIIHSVVPKQNFEQIYSYLEANLDDANRLQVVMRIFLDMELGTLQNNVVPMRVITEGDPKEDKIDKVVDLSDDDEVAVILSGDIPNSKLGLTKRKTQFTGKTSPAKKSKCNFDSNLVEVVDLSKDASLHQGSAVKMIDLSKSCAPLEVPSNLSKLSRKKTQSAIIDMSKSTEPPPKPHNTSAHIHFQTVKEMFPTCDEEYLLGTCQKYGEDMASLVSLTEYLLQHPHLPEQIHNTSPAEVLPEKLASKKNCSKLNIATVPKEPKHNTEKDTSTVRNHMNEKAATDRGLHMEPSSTAGPSSTKEARSHYKVPDDTRENLLTTTTNGWFVSNLDGSIVDVISTSSKSDKFLTSNDGVLLDSQVESGPDGSLVEVITTSSNGAKPSSSNNAADPSTSTNNDSSSLSTTNNDMVESRYQYMLDILPNADPSYLRSECERLMGDEQSIQVFIAYALEKRDYPTLEDYKKRQKALALRKKLTSEFSVESFLEVFPNPFKYFVDKGASADLSKANTYLKNRYPRLRCSDITSNFFKCGHNLAKTCIKLDKSTSHLLMNKNRKILNYKIEEEQNLQFLQEVTFVENMDKIEEFLNAKEKKRKESYEEAKMRGELLECLCCFADDIILEDMAACNDGHLFCKECVKRGAETQIGDDKTVFPCLTTCEAEFSLKTLQAVLKPSIFSRMLQRKQMEEVKAAGIEDLESCPFCDFATILPNDDKVFRCLNPDCMKESCRLCKELNHIPLRCDEVEKSEEVKLRTYIEDRMTQALVRTCWKCKRNFVKEDGCNKMTCSCGAKMCYICRKPVEDYSHFNGQGGTEFEKCPLFSTNNQLHVDAVKEEAIKAKEEVLGQNPTVELKHDPTKNLPNSSAQTRLENRYLGFGGFPNVLHRLAEFHQERIENMRLPQMQAHPVIAVEQMPLMNEPALPHQHHMHHHLHHHHHHLHQLTPQNQRLPPHQVQNGVAHNPHLPPGTQPQCCAVNNPDAQLQCPFYNPNLPPNPRPQCPAAHNPYLHTNPRLQRPATRNPYLHPNHPINNNLQHYHHHPYDPVRRYKANAVKAKKVPRS